MAKSNIKLLTKEERQFFKDNYTFTLSDGFVLVKFNNYKRVVAHFADEPFNIASKVRKIKISTEAIKLWKEHFINSKHNLVDVQNAINALMIGYQSSNINDVKNQLEIIDRNDEKCF